jgi:adenylylsulfate kinase
MSWAIWITGIPGSGKSVLARAASEEMHARGYPVRILELDQIRKTLTPEPRHRHRARCRTGRSAGWPAADRSRVPVIIDATAHRRVADLACAAIPRFAEVQIMCPLEVAGNASAQPLGQQCPTRHL